MRGLYDQTAKYRTWVLAYFVVLLPVGAGVASLQPFCNWDLIPYAAVVYKYEGMDARGAHSAAYQWVKVSLPNGCADALLNESAYRIQCAADWKFFNRQLSFYRVKPLYTGFVFLLHQTGMSLWAALQAASVAGFAGLGAVLLGWLLQSFRITVALGLSSLLLAAFALPLCRLITPDALSAMLLLFLFRELFFHGFKRWYLLVGWWLLLSLCRIDHLLTALPLGYAAWVDRKPMISAWKKGLLSAALLAGCALAAALISMALRNEPDWYFQYRFFDGIGQYARHAVRSLGQFAQTALPLLLALLWVAGPIVNPSWRLVLGILLFAAAIRWLLFPTFQQRFFAGHELILTVYLLQKLYDRNKTKPLNPQV
jgi:hypothetical protein